MSCALATLLSGIVSGLCGAVRSSYSDLSRKGKFQRWRQALMTSFVSSKVVAQELSQGVLLLRNLLLRITVALDIDLMNSVYRRSLTRTMFNLSLEEHLSKFGCGTKLSLFT